MMKPTTPPCFVLALAVLAGCAMNPSSDRATSEAVARMTPAQKQQVAQQIADAMQKARTDQVALDQKWAQEHPEQAARNKQIAAQDAREEAAQEAADGAQIDANLSQTQAPQSSAAYVCGSGPGPGEVQVGETGGGKGVAPMPLCVQK